MKFKNIFCFAIITLLSMQNLPKAYSQGFYTPDGWQWLNSNPFGGHFTGVSAIALDRVYIYGSHGLILLTTDQGDNFKQIIPPDSCIGVITYVAYSKAKSQLAVKWHSTYFYTSDDGKNWTQTQIAPDKTYTMGDGGSGGISVYGHRCIMRGSVNLGCPGGWLNDSVKFSDADNGFLTAYYDSIDYQSTRIGEYINPENILYYTINAGNFWTKSILKSKSYIAGKNLAKRVYFYDNKIGFMYVGWSKTYPYVAQQPKILKTVDGGVTWNLYFAYTTFMYPNYDLKKIYFDTLANNIYTIHEEWANQNTIHSLIFSKNNGSSQGDVEGNYALQDFQKIKSKMYGIGDKGFFEYTKDNNGSNEKMRLKTAAISGNTLFFIDEDTGYVGADQGKVYKTTDGGSNWDDISVAGVNVRNMFFVSSDTGFVVGDSGTMFYTFNGGTKFKPIKTGTKENIQRVYFWNSKQGYFETISGIYGTTDGGASFTKYSAPFNYDTYSHWEKPLLPLVSGMHVFDPSFQNFYYARDYYVLNKNASTASNMGKVTQSNSGLQQVESHFEIVIYPNPASNLLYIKSSNKNVAGSTFSIIDNTGKEVIQGKLISDATPINISSISRGIYLLRVGQSEYSYKFIVE